MPETDDSDYFEYTSGRWIYNDTLRHTERKKTFNVPAFKRLAAQSINRPENDLTGFEKLAEGGFNRSFLMTMRDGFKFVARIPFPVTEPKSLLIASEVATMDFLRLQGLPIPRVFGYSTTADNPAGTEYIFMELVTGTNLGDVWFDLSEQEQTTVITNLVQLESKLMNLQFPAIGSLYYSSDLPDDSPQIPIQPLADSSASKQSGEKQFCVGPDTSFRLWFGKRLNLRVERGPYRDCFAALTAGATKEIAYLEKFGKPLAPFQRLRREVHNYQPQSHLEHIQNLKKYLAIAPHLIPSATNDKYLHRPVIRHPDLQPNNVIVTDNFEVKGLIDWQHSTVMPLFLQSGIPLSIKSHDIIEPLREPTPPIEISKESESLFDKREQLQEAELYRKRRLHYEYMKQTADINPEHCDALSERFNKLRRRLWHLASDPWEGDIVTLKADLITISERWEEITAGSDIDGQTEENCPISFSNEEILECLRLNEAQIEADEQLQECQDIIGVCGEGWTPIASYDKAKAREKKLKMETFQAAETDEERRRLEENWIFDDFSESDYT